MGIGVSIFLLALGAILAFAVDFELSGIDINTIGVILMIVGAIGLAMSALFWNRAGAGVGVGRTRAVTRDTVVDDGVVPAPRTVRERTVVRDDQVL